MTKKKILIPFIIFSTVLTTSTVYVYQMLYAPNFLINQTEKFIIIKEETNFDELRNQLIEDTLLNDVISFSVLSKLMDYDTNIKIGAYKVKTNMSNYNMISMLRSGNQTPINITFSYARKIDDLAEKITEKLKISSEDLTTYLYENLDNYKGFNEIDIISIFLPDTYEVYWNISPRNLVDKMYSEYEKFWNSERLKKLEKINLNKKESIILASIVASETRMLDEADRIAGVYINRLNKNMRLQADPTLVFAANDFTIKRVLNKHKKIKSPYNTYIHKGLPPGPIRLTPKKYIDAVLNYEKHNYIFFCAKEDFSGYHSFATNLRDHNSNARKFQRALNERKIYR
ncbi:MAG: aminodeoxychorismate lyase [Flammeovirgaceae bacterium]|nr:aminodeoxychorismate lyase [Flammeovirgaceae bacterium]|tara:strand:+ start:775 stop:1803 length:1029 start_codon:yes stop_codon:yes gene_type:complete